MSLIGRTNEEVGRGAHSAGKGPPVLFDEPVDESLRIDPRFLGRAHVLRSVLVRPGQEEGLVAALSMMPHEDVGGDRRVRMPDVWARVHVVDRRCQVVARHLQQ